MSQNVQILSFRFWIMPEPIFFRRACVRGIWVWGRDSPLPNATRMLINFSSGPTNPSFVNKSSFQGAKFKNRAKESSSVRFLYFLKRKYNMAYFCTKSEIEGSVVRCWSVLLVHYFEVLFRKKQTGDREQTLKFVEICSLMFTRNPSS